MEIWDAYDDAGELVGVDLIRGQAVPDGLFHMVCEVLVRHRDGEYLLMLRDPYKETHPNEWEASAGGSALKGEDAASCIRRELQEETGLCAMKNEDGTDAITQVGYEVSARNHAIFVNYICTVDCEKSAVTLQKGETVDYKWISEQEFIEFVNRQEGGIMSGSKRRLTPYLQRIGYLQ